MLHVRSHVQNIPSSTRACLRYQVLDSVIRDYESTGKITAVSSRQARTPRITVEACPHKRHHVAPRQVRNCCHGKSETLLAVNLPLLRETLYETTRYWNTVRPYSSHAGRCTLERQATGLRGGCWPMPPRPSRAYHEPTPTSTARQSPILLLFWGVTG